MPKFIKKTRLVDTLPSMRAFLITLLLAILPLQFAWSAASGYCRHETEVGAAHFGHHEHQASSSANEKSKDIKLKTMADSDDCIGCHVSAAYVAPEAPFIFVSQAGAWPPAFRLPTYRSPVPIGLERPARSLAL